MVVKSLAHIKNSEPLPAAARPAARPFAPVPGAGLSKLVTNKDAALEKFLARKKGALSGSQLEAVKNAQKKIAETPADRLSGAAVWQKVGREESGEFVKGNAAATKKRNAATEGPPLSKEEALARFQARKAAAQTGKRQKLEADTTAVLFEERRFVLAWAKTAGATAANTTPVSSEVIGSVVVAYAGRACSAEETAACEGVLGEMLADSEACVDEGVVPPYRALKWLKEHRGNALYAALSRVPAASR